MRPKSRELRQGVPLAKPAETKEEKAAKAEKKAASKAAPKAKVPPKSLT
jgi:hypothetical protein